MPLSIVPDSRVLDLFAKQQQMENDRSTWDSHFRQIAERILPRQDYFQRVSSMEGEKRTEKIFDSTAPLALDRAASAIDSLITPSTQRYHSIEPEDERLSEDRDSKLFCEYLNRLLFRMRYRPSTNFAAQAHECYVSLMAFGTLGMFTDDIAGIGTRYKSIALPELYISENHAGIVDYVHRKFQLSARAALQKFGGKLPETITKAVEKEPFRKFDFLHCVKPNDDHKHAARDYRGMAWSSYYASFEGKIMLAEGGYRTMPYAVSRHVTAPREVYGRSPAMMVLPDIKMINEMEKTIIRAAHKIVDPPLLLYGDGILSSFSTRPNALNYGGVDERGGQLVHPLKTGANLPVAFEFGEQKRKVINDAFYVTLFQILVQNPQMTATEALIRAQEKGQLLAPTVGRQNTEFLGPVIVREVDIYSMAGIIPPMPLAMRRSGGGVRAVYTSPLSQLARAEDGVAIMRTLDAIKPMAELDPTILDTFDGDEIARELADINGMPTRTIRPIEAVQAIRDKRTQQQDTQHMADVAKQGAGALAQTAKAAGLAAQIQPQALPQGSGA